MFQPDNPKQQDSTCFIFQDDCGKWFIGVWQPLSTYGKSFQTQDEAIERAKKIGQFTHYRVHGPAQPFPEKKPMLYKIEYTINDPPFRGGLVSFRAENEEEALELFRDWWTEAGQAMDDLMSYRIVESVGIEP